MAYKRKKERKSSLLETRTEKREKNIYAKVFERRQPDGKGPAAADNNLVMRVDKRWS